MEVKGPFQGTLRPDSSLVMKEEAPLTYHLLGVDSFLASDPIKKDALNIYYIL